MKPLHIEKWAEDKPEIIQLLVPITAMSAESNFDILADVKGNKIPAPFTIPKTSEWLSFYLRHRHLTHSLIAAFRQYGGIPAIYGATLEELTRKKGKGTVQIKENNEQRMSSLDVFKMQNEYIRDEIDGRPPLDKQKKNLVIKNISTPEFLFLCKIVIPCWLLYKDSHTHIFRKARLGHIESLEKLLRLDKHIIQHPRISKWISYYSFQKDKRTAERLAEAIRKPPRLKLTPGKEKYRIAGFISYLTELLNIRLTAPEIQSLFDAIAKDFGHDELRDQDLPESPESFSKAVRRERAIWEKALASTRTKIS